ncbi:MAG: Gmad2 immunoglobulin-like domain-containing protein [Candidatus Pacebacteria bacterium]|nr:Gmad2 immunoglobulin-like domain-containing protein [Candidatus Paceibacterota bacterium]
MKTQKPYIIVLILLFAVGIVALTFLLLPNKNTNPISQTPPSIASFSDCEKAGYPVMESYPRQCRTPDGRTYAEEVTVEELNARITYTNASADLLVIENPTPDSVTGKEFTVTGMARGFWFFEASFPIQVLDSNGKALVTVVAQAQEEWMTEKFVPFKATVLIPSTYTGKATLVLMRDNPSGLPENDASVSIPFTIEY